MGNDPFYFVGIDFGTSGARLIVIDALEKIQFEHAIAFPSQSAARDPRVWRNTLLRLLEAIPTPLKPFIQRIAIDGTSSTILLCDAAGNPLTDPKMYCDRGDPEVLNALKEVAPPEHIVLSLSSSLCKYLSWEPQPFFREARYLLHQADWLAAQLHGQWGVSDYHNSLKLGFDPEHLKYPEWFSKLVDITRLPKPRQPGAFVEQLQPSLAQKLALPKGLTICAGTTDSIAAFLASGAQRIGDAVTSLGSTIALKLLSQNRIDASTYGIYSHWFGKNWLVGGASNAGCAILKRLFSEQELDQLSDEIQWEKPAIETYIPLLQTGERFPINDPTLAPCLEPRPDDSAEFLQGILTSLTRVETRGYEVLVSLGASPLRCIYTAGGGTQNSGWMNWRTTQFDVPVRVSQQPQAAFGAAKLTLQPLDRTGDQKVSK